MNITKVVKARFQKTTQVEMSLEDYLLLAQTDASVYANAYERILSVIGAPELVDTHNDPVLGRVFSNRVIKRYKVFEQFYGMEDIIERLVAYFKHASQGLEESKQVLYLLGPVGGGKSSLAEKIKELIEVLPIYTLKINDELSPIQESPLGLFTKEDSEALKIPESYLKERLSPWATKRLKEVNGDISKFTVVKLFPNQSYQVGVAKVEPGDENNQDISTLVGKVDIHKFEKFSQHDPDAYSYSGGLCHANQGVLEFVEMFKAPIKMLHPLLTATQEGNYNATEAIGSIPFEGVILAHSNESEWEQFKNDKTNEAFIDRIYIVKVPYCLRVSEEVKIYSKLLNHSALAKAPCSPHTLKLLAEFAILTRLKEEPPKTDLYVKLKVYNGENIKAQEVSAKSHDEYKDLAGVTEGMDSGISTRFCYKVLSKTFNFDQVEIAANPVHLFAVLREQLKQEQLPAAVFNKYEEFLDNKLTNNLLEFLEKEINTAYLESYSEYGQNLFDRYINYADFWIQEQDYRDPDTGELLQRSHIDKFLKNDYEIPAEISNARDFRQEVVNFVLRARVKNGGNNPVWTSYEKLRLVIEKIMFSKTEDLLPAISFTAKSSTEETKKHSEFVQRMVTHGYTARQVKILVDFYLHARKRS